MKDRLNLPDELKTLIEKRESGERRRNNTDMRKPDGDSIDSPGNPPEERRSGPDRRHGED